MESNQELLDVKESVSTVELLRSCNRDIVDLLHPPVEAPAVRPHPPWRRRTDPPEAAPEVAPAAEGEELLQQVEVELFGTEFEEGIQGGVSSACGETLLSKECEEAAAIRKKSRVADDQEEEEAAFHRVAAIIAQEEAASTEQAEAEAAFRQAMPMQTHCGIPAKVRPENLSGDNHEDADSENADEDAKDGDSVSFGTPVDDGGREVCGYRVWWRGNVEAEDEKGEPSDENSEAVPVPELPDVQAEPPPAADGRSTVLKEFEKFWDSVVEAPESEHSPEKSEDEDNTEEQFKSLPSKSLFELAKVALAELADRNVPVPLLRQKPNAIIRSRVNENICEDVVAHPHRKQVCCMCLSGCHPGGGRGNGLGRAWAFPNIERVVPLWKTLCFPHMLSMSEGSGTDQPRRVPRPPPRDHPHPHPTTSSFCPLPEQNKP